MRINDLVKSWITQGKVLVTLETGSIYGDTVTEHYIDEFDISESGIRKIKIHFWNDSDNPAYSKFNQRIKFIKYTKNNIFIEALDTSTCNIRKGK